MNETITDPIAAAWNAAELVCRYGGEAGQAACDRPAEWLVRLACAAGGHRGVVCAGHKDYVIAQVATGTAVCHKHDLPVSVRTVAPL